MAYDRRAVIYARFSSDKQRDESIEDQIRVCRSYCDREGYEVVGEYTDRAMSGRSDHRPAFLRMVEEAEGVNAVVVYKMDRFSRDVYDAAIYKKKLADKGIRVVSATENVPDTPEGIILEKLLEGMAAFYSKQLSQNVKRGMEGNALKSKSNGYRIFGYRIDPVTRKYVIDTCEAAIVRDVFARYLSGETLNSISAYYGRLGVKTRRGHTVGYSWAKNMIHNEAYIGVYKWGNVRNPAGIPPIIDRDTFELAQNCTKRRARAMYQYDDYPLTGKLFCGLCGKSMHGKSGKGKSGVKYRYYVCESDGGCRRRPVRADDLEDAIRKEILALVSDERTARSMARRIVESYGGVSDSALKACEERIKENEEAQGNILKAIERGIIPEGTENRLRTLSAELNGLRAQHGSLMAESMELNEDSLTDFLLHGYAEDDSLILDGYLNNVYLFDGYAIATMNFRGESNSLAEVRIAMEELEAKKTNTSREVFAEMLNGAPNGFLLELLPLRHGVGLVIRVAA